MRARSLVAAGLLIFLACLLFNAPAWLLSSAATRFAPNTLVVRSAAGSLWHGRANIQANTPRGVPLDLGTVNWRVRPLDFLRGKLGVSLNAPAMPLGGNFEADVAIGFGQRIDLSALNAQLPANIVQQFVPQLQLMKADGMIDIASPALSVQGQNASGNVTVTWRGFSTRLSKVNPLGDYRVEAQLAAGPINFKLTSPRGPLLLDGSGSWSQATRLSFDGTARLTPGAAPELENLVRLFGRDQGGGVYPISLKNL